jgi:putative membrane protein
MMWFGDHMSGWGYALMGISTLLFWALVIGGVVVLVRYLARSEQAGAPGPVDRPSAEQVLAERFARGEIDEDEYRRRLETLRAAAGPITRS